MTKKHFEAAAAYVRQLRRADFPRAVWTAVEDAFVDVFHQFNPPFDVDRFRAACRGQNASDSAGRTVCYGGGR